MNIVIRNKGNNWVANQKSYPSFIEALFSLKDNYTYIAWSNSLEEEELLLKEMKKLEQNKIPQMVTFGSSLFTEDADYLEFSNVYFNKYTNQESVIYDSWKIKQNCGYIKTSILEAFNPTDFPKEYKVALATLAYASYASGGIVSVSVLENYNFKRRQPFTNREYFLFINYVKKRKWVFYLIFCKLFFERKIIFPWKNILKSKYRNYFRETGLWNNIITNNQIKNKTVDVLIPTLGRPNYLFDVVSDLNKQKFKIGKLIIVEQKLPNQNETLLKKILESKWNFKIQHFLLDHIGLCNARNVGIKTSNADYILMFDDDVRIEYQEDFISKLVEKIEQSKAYAISFSTNGKKGDVDIRMKNELAGGASLIRRKDCLLFNKQIEGMGSDDQDYNFSVRSKFNRVVYTHQVYINHLKAKAGGWRFDATNYLPWYKDNKIVPLPGPATTYRFLKYATKNQIKGYKLFIFLKYYGSKPWRFFEFIKRWNKSIYWANETLKGKVHFNNKEGIIKQ